MGNLERLDLGTLEAYMKLLSSRWREMGAVPYQKLYTEAMQELRSRVPDPEFEPIPEENQPDFIMCVHEGVCPVCGRWSIPETSVVVLQDSQDPRMLDHKAYRLICAVGHESHAEPTAGGDWAGWVDYSTLGPDERGTMPGWPLV